MGTTDETDDGIPSPQTPHPPPVRPIRWPPGWRLPAGRRLPGAGRMTVLLTAVLLATGLLVAAWLEARQVGSQSDSASVALQAWAMLHGNLLLRGWRTADVSFYTTEIPVYMLVEAVRGLRVGVSAIVEAINYTLLVTGAALVAKGSARGRAGLARAAVAAAVMLAPSLVAAQWLLYGADHAATAIWVLLAVGVLQRTGRRWPGPALAGLILAWAIVGDPLVQVIGAAPLALVGLVRAWRPGRTGGAGRVPPRERWYELSLVASAGAAVAAAHVATGLISSAGGWQIVSSGQKFVPETSLPSNLAVEAGDFLGLFSADFFGQKVGPEIVPVFVHLAGAAAVAAALAAAVRRFGRDDDLTTDVLVVAIGCNLLAYLLLFRASPGQVREVSPVFALGAALAGRTLGGPLARARLEPLLAAGIAACLLTMGPALTGRPAPPQTQPLAGWLLTHHLTSGLAGYWQANSVALDSAAGGSPAITVRPVKGDGGGRPVPYVWETYLPAFAPASRPADFLVLTTGILAAHPAITVAGAAREFGAPAHVYRFGPYTIVTWRHNILRELR